MTVGIRSHPHQAQNAASNTFQYFANNMAGQSVGKSPYGNQQLIDEQTVPQALYQPQMDSYKDLPSNFQSADPLAYSSWYNNSQSFPSYNTNFLAYPITYQANYDTTSTIQDNGNATLRQNSITNNSLDQFLPELDYEQVLENFDLAQYDNPESFCLEDYANLEQVHEGNDFAVAVKQEKTNCDKTDGKNLEEMEDVMNNNILNTGNATVDVVTTESPISNVVYNPVHTNDQTLDEQNLMEILEMYSSPNSDWQSSGSYQPSGNHVLGPETTVKSELNTNNCDFAASLCSNNTDEGLPATNEELVQMPVSRFNELLLSLTPEQSHLAKDIRRRGKNKQAARLCRKRKLDNISALEETLVQMEDKKSKLLSEQQDIIAETNKLKSCVDMICEMLMKGLNEDNLGLSELSLLHHSHGQTLLVQK